MGLNEIGRLILSFPEGRPYPAADSKGGFHFVTRLRTSAWQSIEALILVGVTTVVYFAIDRLGLLNFVPVVYLIPVVIAATRWGLLPAIVASIAGFMASDYYFYEPYYSLEIDDPQEIVTLLLFLVVALVTSDLAARLKNEADVLRANKKELNDLYAFSRRLAACFTVPELIFAIQEYLSTTLGRQTFVIAEESAVATDSPDAKSVPEAVRREAAAMVAAGDLHLRSVVEPQTKHVWLITSISTDYANRGAIAIDLGVGSSDAIDDSRRQVELVLADAIERLERLDLAKAMEEANLRLMADEFKEALIGGVSHDLRTPLASILGLVSVIAKFPRIHDDERIRSLVDAVQDEAKQLDGDIKNLLDATQITKHGIHPQREWVDPADIVNAAIRQRARHLFSHRLQVEIEPELPLVKVNSTMIEQTLGQLLENAAKYSQTGSTIQVSAKSEHDRVVLSVRDEGSGLTAEEAQQLFKRATRGPRHANIPGTGLGLWIGNTFVTANGGTMEITSRGAGLGTTASIWLSSAGNETSEASVLAHG